MGTSVDMQDNQRLDDSPLEVSYSVFTINKEQEKTQILQTIATTINVQLTLEEQNHIPFVAPTDFQLANSQDRLFSYGPSGSGKSRIIFELTNAKLDEKNIERLYIINPRQALGKNIQWANLMQLSHQFTCHDIVVWDDFPDGLMKKDIDTGKLALQIISSSIVNLCGFCGYNVTHVIDPATHYNDRFAKPVRTTHGLLFDKAATRTNPSSVYLMT